MRNVNFFTKRLNNNKGLTLVEAVVAIAMIGIVSVGMTTLFFSLSKTSKMSEEQLKQNAICRVLKENVVISARTGDDIYGAGTNKKVSNVNNTEDLKVVDRSGNEYPEYVFNLEKLSEEIDFGDAAKKVKKYKITLKNDNSVILTEFITEIYH